MSAGGVTQRDFASSGSSARPAWLKSRPPVESSPADSEPLVRPQSSLVSRRRLGHLAWWSAIWHAIRHLYIGWGLGVSLTLHAGVLIGLGAVVFHQNSRQNVEFQGVFGAPGEETVLDLPVDSRLDDATGQDAAPLEFIASTALSDAAAMQATSDRILGAIDGHSQGAGEGGEGSHLGAMSNIRVPESAVTRGSFTVWTEPEDPLPRQRYNIVIQVKLPASVKQYRLRDLTGDVRGTDGYFKQIRYNSTERRGVKDGVVQIQVAIPGAVQLIKDTIRIKSELLKEQQTIEIEF